jgi:hypothetical protein
MLTWILIVFLVIIAVGIISLGLVNTEDMEDKCNKTAMIDEYEEQFRAENPQTMGEIDQQFNLDNYKDWLEKKLDAITSRNRYNA